MGVATLSRRLPRLTPGDGAVAGAIAVFLVLALLLAHSVRDLGRMSDGLTDTGTALQRTGGSTADGLQRSTDGAATAIGSVPVLGGGAADLVRRTGRRQADAIRREAAAEGGRLIVTGRQGRRDVHHTATLVEWFAFLVPTILLLAIWLPRRAPRRPGPP